MVPGIKAKIMNMLAERACTGARDVSLGEFGQRFGMHYEELISVMGELERCGYVYVNVMSSPTAKRPMLVPTCSITERGMEFKA